MLICKFKIIDDVFVTIIHLLSVCNRLGPFLDFNDFRLLAQLWLLLSIFFSFLHVVLVHNINVFGVIVR